MSTNNRRTALEERHRKHSCSWLGIRPLTTLLAAGLIFLSGCATVRETNRPKHWEIPYADSTKDIEGVYHSLCQHQQGNYSRFTHLDDELGGYFDMGDYDSRYFRIKTSGEQQVSLEFFDASGLLLTTMIFDISYDGKRLLAAPVNNRMRSGTFLNTLRLTTTESKHLTVFLDIEHRSFLETHGFEHYFRCESIQR